MLTRRQNLPEALSASVNISILLVSPEPEDEKLLQDMLGTVSLDGFVRCARLEEAMPQVRDTQPSVVICERDLPDGNWKTILGTCEALAQPPVVLVVSRHADENLWAEVLNLGGYDVLLKPFDRMEVIRVIGSCCRQWSETTARQPASSAPGQAPWTAQYA